MFAPSLLSGVSLHNEIVCWQGNECFVIFIVRFIKIVKALLDNQHWSPIKSCYR